MAAHQAPPSLGFSRQEHFLLQCRKVKSESEVIQSCPTFPGKSTGVGCHFLLQPTIIITSTLAPWALWERKLSLFFGGMTSFLSSPHCGSWSWSPTAREGSRQLLPSACPYRETENRSHSQMAWAVLVWCKPSDTAVPIASCLSHLPTILPTN